METKTTRGGRPRYVVAERVQLTQGSGPGPEALRAMARAILPLAARAMAEDDARLKRQIESQPSK